MNRPKVVVVDDDPTIGGLLSGALDKNGFAVEVFHSPIAALEAFQADRADILVSDWIMPGLDGLSLIDSVRARYPSMATMLITSYSEHQDVREACEAGRVDAVISKPFDLRSFLSTVRSFLNTEEPKPAGDVLSPGVWVSGREKTAGGWRSSSLGREAFFESVLESLADAVLVVDKTGRINYYNHGAVKLFGLSGQEAATLFLEDLCPAGSSLPQTAGALSLLHPPEAQQNQAFFKRLDGKNFYSIFSSSLFMDDRGESSLLLVIKEVNDSFLSAELISEKNKSLELMAITDPLTGLYNRRHLDRRLSEEFKRLGRYNSALTLIMIDFDHFKRINDLYGHLTGDKVLQRAARVMASSLRDVDTLARWGGEEFMALLPETNAKTALTVARRLNQTVGDQSQWAALCPELEVTVSMGLVSLPWLKRPSTQEDALELLDQALYKAKHYGRNRAVHYLDQCDEFEEI